MCDRLLIDNREKIYSGDIHGVVINYEDNHYEDKRLQLRYCDDCFKKFKAQYKKDV